MLTVWILLVIIVPVWSFMTIYNFFRYGVIIMNGFVNFIINMLYNLGLFWDIEEQHYHRTNKLRARNKSIYYFGPMTKK